MNLPHVAWRKNFCTNPSRIILIIIKKKIKSKLSFI